MKNPIIFIGMHRSGTTMLAGLLERLGLFIGRQKDDNSEALLFQKINSWLLLQCGCSWEVPGAINYLWQNDEIMVLVEHYIKSILASPRSIRFLGLTRYLLGHRIISLDIPWGWKDPRSTFTLPIWLRIFPNAKVICIERHGVDVAQSLLVRGRRVLETAKNRYERYHTLAFLRPFRGGFIDSIRCNSLEGGLSLWQEYTNQCDLMLRTLSSNRVLVLRYEEILSDPTKYLKMCSDFCELTPSEKQLENVACNIRTDRGLSYRKDPDLIKFASRNQSILNEHEYDA